MLKVLEQFPADKQARAKVNLLKLRNIVQECMGYEEQSQVVEHAALFLFWMLLEQRVVTIASKMRVRSMFGSVFENKFTKMQECVCALRELLEDYQIGALKQWNRKTNRDALDKKSWGTNIRIRLKGPPLGDLHQLQDLAPTAQLIKNASVNFSMQWNQEAEQQRSSNDDSELSQLLEISIASGDPKLVAKVSEQLSSKRSNNELQNELIELLGFERFDLVQQLLEQRSSIAAQLEQYEKREQRLQFGKLTQQQRTAGNTEMRPTVAKTVVVQSALEKELNKQNRREEKKLQRMLNSINRNNSEDEKVARALNPTQLRLQQQRKLLENVQQQPVLKTTQRLQEMRSATSYNSNAIQYPYVFDSQLNAKQHAGFIGGNRLSLPDHAERIDNKQYEEVKIAANEPPPLSIGNNQIQISDLDDIGKMAFENCTQLNRIQSVVYPVAYHTNENMLVCAPTGAGKTNVAMLAMVHTIRAHLENGVINRDQFKIVYIAPMKALAAEMVDNFGKRLKSLNILVRELTGDMQLTKTEMTQTQVLVTTPEKWDVVTRKGEFERVDSFFGYRRVRTLYFMFFLL